MNVQYTFGRSRGNTGGSNEALTAANNARAIDEFRLRRRLQQLRRAPHVQPERALRHPLRPRRQRRPRQVVAGRLGPGRHRQRAQRPAGSSADRASRRRLPRRGWQHLPRTRRPIAWRSSTRRAAARRATCAGRTWFRASIRSSRTAACCSSTRRPSRRRSPARSATSSATRSTGRTSSRWTSWCRRSSRWAARSNVEFRAGGVQPVQHGELREPGRHAAAGDSDRQPDGSQPRAARPALHDGRGRHVRPLHAAPWAAPWASARRAGAVRASAELPIKFTSRRRPEGIPPAVRCTARFGLVEGGLQAALRPVGLKTDRYVLLGFFPPEPPHGSAPQTAENPSSRPTGTSDLGRGRGRATSWRRGRPPPTAPARACVNCCSHAGKRNDGTQAPPSITITSTTKIATRRVAAGVRPIAATSRPKVDAMIALAIATAKKPGTLPIGTSNTTRAKANDDEQRQQREDGAADRRASEQRRCATAARCAAASTARARVRAGCRPRARWRQRARTGCPCRQTSARSRCRSAAGCR